MSRLKVIRKGVWGLKWVDTEDRLIAETTDSDNDGRLFVEGLYDEQGYPTMCGWVTDSSQAKKMVDAWWGIS
jgi:hypothetical protein